MKRAPNKTKLSFFHVTRCTPVEEAAANEKKERVFPRLIGQIAFNLFFFSGVTVDATWTNEKKERFFPA